MSKIQPSSPELIQRGPYILLLWNQVPKDHPNNGFGMLWHHFFWGGFNSIIVVYMDPVGNESIRLQGPERIHVITLQ